MDWSLVWVYAAPLVIAASAYRIHRARADRRNRARLERAIAEGLDEPASLHPVVNPNRCLGCATCVTACPEGRILGLIEGKARLIEPSHCIGHGACKTACPVDAITLVLGTEKNGVEVPVLDPEFQTNVPGLFVAGELGGMGLVRNAVEQGRQAMEAIRRVDGVGSGEGLDVVIVGAGPAGFSASLAALEAGLRCETFEQESLGGTVAHYPRGKIVMTAPMALPIVGEVRLWETTKEALIELWESVEQRTGVEIRYGTRVESIERDGAGFRVTTSAGVYPTRTVLLAIGRRGSPRTLGVPGEEQTKVVYRLIDPEQYRGQRVLVVGGGDSALEAATSLADEPGTEVTLSYRSDAFKRAKPKNRDRVAAAEAAGRLRVRLRSEVREILDDAVHLETPDGVEQIANDAVIVAAGGILPTGFLRAAGVEVETRYGTP
ncbi:MAG TPA: NAD(P)-binding domain-containing protein [Myxococcota bacterium]|nr:NAD(P)-binding domain-containing protein [Myxococcota bacterium]